MAIATFAGKCVVCTERIDVGTEFAWARERGKRQHVDCTVASVERHIERSVTIDFSSMAAPVRSWSRYQEALFEFGVNGKGSGMVVAVAGSGKTTAIEELCRRMPSDLSIRYLVFNKKNAVEAQQRMPSNVEASTFHSACTSPLMRRIGRTAIDSMKVRKLLDGMVDSGFAKREEVAALGNSVTRLVGIAKNAGLDALVANTPAEWFKLIDHFGIEFDFGDDRPIDEAQKLGIELAMEAFDRSVADVSTIDFDDMLYLTIKLDVALPRFDVVCVDEAQDTNAVQRAILHKMLKPGGRLIAVGDPKQAIYGFRGADADAMMRIQREFECVTLPLSINYRCSRAVIEAAKAYCPTLEACEDAPAGAVISTETFSILDFDPSDVVLCRTTAPLISLAYKLLKAGIGCVVLGRDIGKGLTGLVRKLQGKQRTMTLEQLEQKLNTYKLNEIRRLAMRGQEDKAQAIEDKCDSIVAAIDSLPEDAQTIDALIAHIDRLFSDDPGTQRVTFATIHKAKGLEWSRVILLNRSKMPSKWARQPWALEQEGNLIYVAYTRAKDTLVFIEEEGLVSGPVASKAEGVVA